MFEKYKNANKKILVRRIIMVWLGNVLIGAGISLFTLSAFGNDPHSSMMYSLADKIGPVIPFFSTFSNCFYVASAVYFLAEVLFARDLIGMGTVANWFCTGFFTGLFNKLLGAAFPEPTLVIRALALVIGLQILCFGVSMYQVSDLGVGPYDGLAIILDRKLPLKYFWCRIFVDGTCALVAILLGSFGTYVGLGTLISAFGLGPFISFYNRTVCEKLVKEKE